MRVKFTANVKSVSVNSAYGRQGYRSFLTKEASLLQEEIKEAIEEQIKEDIKFKDSVIIKMKIEREGSSHWDIDNQAKLIIDSIVKAGLIIDDDLVYELHMLKGMRKINCVQVIIEDYNFKNLY